MLLLSRILKTKLTGLLLLTLIVATPALAGKRDKVSRKDLRKDVALDTDLGQIIIRLSDETPLHRDNFLLQVKKGELDSLDFYRVIEGFLIQTGKDSLPDSPNLIPAEFRPDLFHRRGAVNAAREGDDTNPSQASANLHFTIIQGKVQTDSTLLGAEKRINEWRAYNEVINADSNKALFTCLQQAMTSGNSAEAAKIQTQLNQLTQEHLKTIDRYEIPEAHREVYKTEGGSPHLDQNYTVFGMVVLGMDVVDEIAGVKTDRADKPYKPIYIQKAYLIKRKDYPVN